LDQLFCPTNETGSWSALANTRECHHHEIA